MIRTLHIAGMLMFGLIVPGMAEAESGRWAGQWRKSHEPADPQQIGDLPDHGITADAVARGLDELLVDEARVLSPGAMTERTEFLRNHAEESQIDLRAMVFGEAQVLPDDLPMDTLFSESKDAIVIYFMGEPQRAALYFPKQLAAAVSDAEQRRALQSSIMQAVGKEEPEEQFEAFLTQMSIRLYWMERMMNDGTAVKEPSTELIAKTPEPEKLWFDEIKIPGEIIPWIAGGGAIGIALPFVWWWRRSRAKFRFPEIDVEPRLGGPHGAGVGAVISYLSAKVPPAEQREQRMDLEERR